VARSQKTSTLLADLNAFVFSIYIIYRLSAYTYMYTSVGCSGSFKNIFFPVRFIRVIRINCLSHNASSNKKSVLVNPAATMGFDTLKKMHSLLKQCFYLTIHTHYKTHTIIKAFSKYNHII